MKPCDLQDKTNGFHGSTCEICQPEGPTAKEKERRRAKEEIKKIMEDTAG